MILHENATLLSQQPSTAGYGNPYTLSSWKGNQGCFDWFYRSPQSLVQHCLQGKLLWSSVDLEIWLWG